ncbi:MAG: tetratricopeptide repeat protein [Termitinemataceae bacterium]
METAAALNDSAIALTEANRPKEAISLFRKALAMEPANPLLWLNLGIAQQKSGDYTGAMDSLYCCLSFDSTIAEAWNALGLIHYELEQFQEAEQLYKNALEKDRFSPKIWNNLGVLYFSIGSYEEARFAFEEAVTLSPHFYDALFNLRDTCTELGDYRAAAEFGRRLSELQHHKTVRLASS